MTTPRPPAPRGGLERDVVTADQLRALTTTAGGKYHAKRTWVEELKRWFQSQYEADAAVTLVRRQRAGEIRGLAFQVRYPLVIDGELICTYVADFLFEERDPDPVARREGYGWVTVVADAKGFPTPIYRLKKRLMQLIAGIEIREL